MTERGYRTPTADDDADVPYWLGALAEDVSRDVGAVAEWADEAAKVLPSIGSSPDHLAVFLDALRQETWLGARASDGGPTDWAVQHMRSRLGIGPVDVPDAYLFALTDAARNLTDLAIRASDGQFADFVVERLRPRILDGYLPELPELRQYADVPFTPGSGVYPLAADTKRAAGWGSSSMESIGNRLASMFQARGASFFAGGKSAERAEHIAARMGSVPALVTVAGGTVPASGGIDITVSNVPVHHALRAYAGTLAGIPGTVSYVAAGPSGPARFRFTRTGSGTARTVPADTPFIPDAVSYQDAVVLLWMGKNNTGEIDGDTRAIRLTDASFDWLAPLAKKALVLGHFNDTQTPADSLKRAHVNAINAAHRKRYGRLFVDVDAYLTGAQVWADTGITPTAADLAEQAQGNKPPSLSTDSGHLNGAGNDAVRDFLLIPQLDSLNWF